LLNDSNVSNNFMIHFVFCCSGTRLNPCNRTVIIFLSSSVSILEVVLFSNAGGAEQAVTIACDDSLIMDSASRSFFFL